MDKPWWNEKCQEAVNNRKNAYAVYNENSNVNNVINFKEMDALAKKHSKEAKKQKWKEYCGRLNRITPTKEVWAKLNQYKNKKWTNRIPLNEDSIEDWIEKFQDKLSEP